MAGKRRIGAENSETRARILDAAEQVIRDEGYAAASTRRVAAVAGLQPSLVHYYFPTTEDVFLAVFRRGAEQSDALLDAALAGADPVHALWRIFTDTSRNRLTIEFLAYASHREGIRAEVARHSADMRARQAELMQRVLGDRIGAEHQATPEGLALILAGIGRALAMEAELGIESGHDDARRMVENWLDRVLSAQSEPAPTS
ncbi:TetR/AcrR family transcriptional regulator [Stakelama tenebrarum]|uniref:TetR/AcrR family transcriptional regulator n=1 Tax=Stakelama tenebrarum TaxID=2711215 RepID=A0A6G6Y7H5_9SPHN|nr:TetR/AcrR family transcriptional regulator [Sphingosinithalassobacter tenebrarum]QIG80801.1 TetR/AcrR family transcriptional regulator [Sphingosinithalassobacter tenebrarum]